MSRQWPRLRRRPVPARRLRRSSAEAPEDPVPRIDALTSAGRANWLALLGYLAFVMVTTLGVEDIDFFVDSRQTQLPLVNVSIPTFSFFVFAPILGTALYAYLHLHVRKVTEALAVNWTAPQPLEERIKPWLLNVFVLRQRADRDRVIRPRPLDWLARVTTLLLVWWAGPIVLGLMWVWTWPAHELWLSLLCAACLMLSVYAGALSWTKMRQDLGRWRQRATAVTTVMTILLCLPVLWLTTANSKGIGEYVIRLPEDEDDSFSSIQIDEDAPLSWIQQVEAWARKDVPSEQVTWPRRTGVWAWEALNGLAELDPPDLTAARLSVLPPEEADLDTARHRYRNGFCERRGIDAEICDRAPSAAYVPPAHLVQKRQKKWCDPRSYVDGAELDCAGFFADLDADFVEEWTAYRSALIASIAKPDLRGKDLRRALLAQAELSGTDLRQARMEGADLREARMEGADLREARMEGASLWLARMEGADLSRARMEGAILWQARMEGASLWLARMEGADLSRAQMEGAILWQARMQSVEWAGGTNNAAAAHSTDFRGSETLTQDRLSQMVGNTGTLLPDTPDPETGLPLHIPSCWKEKPDGWAALVANFGGFGRHVISETGFSAAFLCSADRPLCKTGTPWPLDKPPPDDSQLREPYDCVPVE